MYLRIPPNICLVDKPFYILNRIDIILGTELFFNLLKADKTKLSNNLYLQSSVLGYIISGCIYNNVVNNTAVIVS